MNGETIRVVIGEAQPARAGLLRFALENEGYDVVAEATSTMELAQMLVRHRPHVVVLDDGIDAGAIGMVREVLPSAKLVLVWPRGVTAVGADARLEPSEVLSGLGPTLQRLLPTRPVITTERPRVAPPEVIVVPDVEGPPVPEDLRPAPAPGAAEPVVTVAEEETKAPTPTAPEPLSLEAPRWVYRAEGESERSSRANIWAAAIAAAAVILAVIAGIAFLGRTGGTRATRAPSVSSISPTSPPTTTPTPTPSPTPSGTTTQPGTFGGNVRTKANGAVRFSARGRVRLSLRGHMRLVAHGDVRVRGTGVVRSVSGRTVRVSGTGVVQLVLTGRVRLHIQGALRAQVVGTTRVGGNGQFVIHRGSAGT